MASLRYFIYVLASLLDPIGFLLFGPHEHLDQYSSISSSTEHNHKKVALFVFGDSLFEAGNSQYLPTRTVDDVAMVWPYGRFTDGRIVPDLIAKFANSRMLPPYLKPGPHDFTDGSNFAFAGAGVFATTNPEMSASLPVQMSYFRNVTKLLQQKLGYLEANRTLRNAVYLISIGGCDYSITYGTYSNVKEPQQREYVATVIDILTPVLQEIYDIGGRKFAFQNVGSLGCLPSNRHTYGLTEGCVEGLQSFAKLHNTALANVLKELEGQLSGFKYSVFNYFDATLDRYLNPATYGFINGTDACCGTGLFRGAADCGGDNGTEPFELCEDPGKYVWFDADHSTERANFQFAKLIWSGTTNITGPYNVQQLFQQVYVSDDLAFI